MKRTVLVVLAVLAASPLLASDGVIEINQARALKGGITAGDGAGFPITISTGGAYRLTSNLVVGANVDAIDITASDVSLDLNGFTIKGPTVCDNAGKNCTPTTTGYGIVVISPAQRTAVHDGSVSGFADGIHAYKVYDMLVRNVIASNCSGNAIDISHGTVENSLVSQNGNGILVGAGIVRRCVSTRNAGVGILGGSAGVIEDNSVYNNGGDGISTGVGARVAGNNSYGNLGWALIGNAGYVGNTLSGTNTVNGAISLGPNLCNNALCP